MSRLSEHFTTEEFACRCGCGFDTPVPELVQVAEAIRHSLQEPVHINSGCRCPAHNEAIGGSRCSWHMSGQAMDLPVDDKEERFRIVAAAMAAGATDIGVYDWGVHIAVDTPIGLWRGR